MQLAIAQELVTNRVSTSGKVLGQRITFTGSLRASDVKAALKASGIKGRDLTTKVNAVLKGESDVRWMTFDALASSARSAGFIPDYADASNRGMVARFVKPAEPKAKAEKVPTPAEPSPEAVQNAAIALVAQKMGVTPDEAKKVLGIE